MLPPMDLAGRRVVVGIAGGIAAFKAAELVREIGRRGAEVRVVMTASAARFVGPITFSGITGHPAVTDLWDPAHAGEVHVELGAWADAVVVAPATMNLLARAAAGMADDPVLATVACARGPVLMAPAMHARMWAREATQRNVARLVADGVRLVGPVDGPLASGEQGMGRMAEAAAIADALADVIGGGVTGDLTGRRVLVTAGPTFEDLDPVRFLGNRSSGKMGYALAARAAERGAAVTLVSGPVALAPPPGVTRVSVRSARDMHAAVLERVDNHDAVIMAAAVADYRPAAQTEQKIAKGEAPMRLELVRNPDILAELGARRKGPRPVLIGFALETHDVVERARRKLTKKKCDMVIANEAKDGFGGDDNVATLVLPECVEVLGRTTKTALADRILDRLAALLESG